MSVEPIHQSQNLVQKVAKKIKDEKAIEEKLERILHKYSRLPPIQRKMNEYNFDDTQYSKSMRTPKFLRFTGNEDPNHSIRKNAQKCINQILQKIKHNQPKSQPEQLEVKEPSTPHNISSIHKLNKEYRKHRKLKNRILQRGKKNPTISKHSGDKSLPNINPQTSTIQTAIANESSFFNLTSVNTNDLSSLSYPQILSSKNNSESYEKKKFCIKLSKKKHNLLDTGDTTKIVELAKECQRQSKALKIDGLGFEGTSYYQLLQKEIKEKELKEENIKKYRSKQTPLLLPPKKHMDYYQFYKNLEEKVRSKTHESKNNNTPFNLHESFDAFDKKMKNIRKSSQDYIIAAKKQLDTPS